MIKIFAFLFGIFLLYASAHSADRIRIGVPPAGGHITLPLAQKKGFLKDEGVEAEIIRIAGGVATAALVNDEINYFTGITFPVRAAIQGLPIRIVACYLPAPPFVLIARPEIKSLQELKGKTLGVAEIGQGPDVIGRMILKQSGLDPDKDMKFIRAGGSEGRLAAMNQGLISATVLPVPWDVHAKKMGFHVLAKAYELISYPEVGLVVTLRKIKERPDEIKRVIRAGIKANRYIRTNREPTVQFQIDWLRIDRELAVSSYDSLSKVFNEDGSVPEQGLGLIIEEAKNLAKVRRDVALNEVADFSILRQAQKELGIKGK
jgi:ABC-type nitrate/sulfonate/bicarbonate transport system substrate-binding protein